MALGLPSINIEFIQEGITAIQRGSRGIVALVLKDTKATGTHTVFDVTDVPKELSDENKDYIKMALKGNTKAPLRVELFVLGATGELVEALEYFENVQFDYLAHPTATSADNTTLETWIKSMRDNEGIMCKVVLANTRADHEGVVNFTQEGIKVGEKTYTALQFTPRIAGLICGTDLRISTTYANMPEVSEIPFEKKLTTSNKIGEGELVLFKEAKKIKIARGVTSLTTTSQVKGSIFQKIKCVDIMDIITNDIRRTARENYIGKYANSYDNKCILMTAIAGYLDKLVIDGLIEKNTVDVSIDMEAQTAFIKGIGIDVSELTEQQIKEYNTQDKVFIKIKCKILDAIEEIYIKCIV